MSGHPRILRPTDAFLADCLRLDHLAASGSTERQAELIDAAREGRMRVAVIDDRGAGYTVLAPWFFGQPFLQLLYVDAAQRRRGIAAQLMADFEADHGPELFTSTNLSNAPMHALLRARNWSPRGMLHWMHDDDPEVFYAKLASA
jgi:GNAT superfamily N-acetyltransferase